LTVGHPLDDATACPDASRLVALAVSRLPALRPTN
jgi:hypothetical protein